MGVSSARPLLFNLIANMVTSQSRLMVLRQHLEAFQAKAALRLVWGLHQAWVSAVSPTNYLLKANTRLQAHRQACQRQVRLLLLAFSKPTLYRVVVPAACQQAFKGLRICLISTSLRLLSAWAPALRSRLHQLLEV
jgi:hypothetical protein